MKTFEDFERERLREEQIEELRRKAIDGAAESARVLRELHERFGVRYELRVGSTGDVELSLLW